MGAALGRELDLFGLASIEQLTIQVRSPRCRRRETSAAASYRAVIFSSLSYAGGGGPFGLDTRGAGREMSSNVDDDEASEQSVSFDRSQVVGPPWKVKTQLASNRNCNTRI